MPTGGEFPATSGLQLQGAYPGSPNGGNASITGSFGVLGGLQCLGNSGQTGAVVGLGGFSAPFLQGVTSTYDTGALGNGGIANTIAMGELSVIRAQNNVLSGIYLGAQQQIFGATSGAIGIGIGIIIGTNGSSTNLAPIVIGSGAAFLTSTVSTTQDGVLIGRGAKIQTQTPLVIPGSVLIGRSNLTLATGTTKGCIVIGDGLALGAVTPVDNTILIDQWGTGVTPVRDISNAIIIGNITHTTVIIAGKSLGSVQGVLWRKITAVTVVNTVADTSLLDAGQGNRTIPANTLQVGQYIRIRSEGFFSAGAVAGIMNFKVKIGAQTKTVGGTITVQNSAGNAQWIVEADFLVTAVGAGGTTTSNVRATVQQGSGSNVLLAAGTRGQGDALDTTVANTVDVSLQWGTADAALTATATTTTVETF